MKTISAIGLGNRGTEYLAFIKYFHKRKMNVVALCDMDKIKLQRQGKVHKVVKENLFNDSDKFFEKGLLSDALIIATQDKTHFEITKKAILTGYKYILLEKPVSSDIKECEILRDMAKENNVKLVVCHVLRYSKYFLKIKNAIRSGMLGEIININHSENVGYFHFAHSYVRGNWNNEAKSSPSIMAKCCHDLDLLYWFANSKPTAVSSVGKLYYFRKENAPNGATARCLDGCKAQKNCPYDAEATYITNPFWKATFVKQLGRTVTGISNPNKKQRYEALKTRDYGKCVFFSDNDVCDNQNVYIQFENGVTANLTMTAFSKTFHRETHIYGTKGELIANNNKIKVRLFDKGTKTLDNGWFALPGHIEGDIKTIKSFVDLVNGKEVANEDITFIDTTCVSHKLGDLAEKSRKLNGEKFDY